MTDHQAAAYKDKFYRQAVKILTPYSEELECFQKHWDQENFRGAYLIYHDVVQKKLINKNDVDQGVDSDFYWYFVS